MHTKKVKPQPVYCSGDLKGLEGHKVLRVLADEHENIFIKLVDDNTGHVVKVRIDNVSLDGRAVTFKEWQGSPHSETVKKKPCRPPGALRPVVQCGSWTGRLFRPFSIGLGTARMSQSASHLHM